MRGGRASGMTSDEAEDGELKDATAGATRHRRPNGCAWLGVVPVGLEGPILDRQRGKGFRCAVAAGRLDVNGIRSLGAGFGRCTAATAVLRVWGT